MPVTPQTLTLGTEQPRRVQADIDDVTRLLVSSWATSWDQLFGVWYPPLATLAGSGVWPGRAAVYQATAGAFAATGEELRRLHARTPTLLTRPVSDAASAAADTEPAVIRSQLPPVVAAALVVQPAEPGVVAGIVDTVLNGLPSGPGGVLAVMRRTTTQGPHRGVLRVDPARATSTLLRTLETVYNRSLTAALTSGRTAVAEAARRATEHVHTRNRRLLWGWRWTSRLTPTTCPTCLSLHGREFSLTTPGPRDHPNGQCYRTVVVKPWRLLGVDLPEPPGAWNDAQAWFWNLPEPDQTRIMGGERLRRLRDGELSWADLAQRTPARRIRYKTRPLTAA